MESINKQMRKRRLNRATIDNVLDSMKFLKRSGENDINSSNDLVNDVEDKTKKIQAVVPGNNAAESREILEDDIRMFNEEERADGSVYGDDENESDPNVFGNRIKVLKEVSSALNNMGLSESSIRTVVEISQKIWKYNISYNDIKKHNEDMLEEFASPSTVRQCSGCHNPLSTSYSSCANSNCSLNGIKPARGASSQHDVVTTYSIKNQLLKVIHNQMDSLLMTHRYHHFKPNDSELDLSSLHLSKIYGDNIETVDDFEALRLKLPVSISFDGFCPKNLSKTELTPLYMIQNFNLRASGPLTTTDSSTSSLLETPNVSNHTLSTPRNQLRHALFTPRHAAHRYAPQVAQNDRHNGRKNMPRMAPYNVPPLPPRHEAPTIPPNQVLMRGGGIHLSPAEYEFYETLDVNQPIAANLSGCVAENVIDLGTTGLVLLKYDISERLDSETYKECVRIFSHHQLELLPSVSRLGELAPRVHQLGLNFYMSVNSKRLSTVFQRNKQAVQFKLKPCLIRCQKLFQGRYPFRNSVNVSICDVSRFPSDIQRSLSMMIRQLLSQILADPTAHQKMALRFGDKNAKRHHQSIPRYVSKFVKEFCCSSYGYPAALHIPGYSLDQLATDNAEMFAKLGSTAMEREANFGHLLEDVDQFGGIVFSKLQRALNDLRNHTLHFEEQIIDGHTRNVGQFIENEHRPKEAQPTESQTSTENQVAEIEDGDDPQGLQQYIEQQEYY